MKKMKRGLALLLSVLMMISLSTVSAFAQDALLVLTIDNESPSVGDTINITITAENVGKVQLASLFFRFDPEVWEFVSVNNTTGIQCGGEILLGTNDMVGVNFMCSFDPPPASFEICSITFKVLKTGTAIFEPVINEWCGGVKPQFTELCAQGRPTDTLTFEIVDGKAVVTHCDNKTAGAVAIPDTYEGYPVTAIGDYAFFGCLSLTDITIPDSVTSIGSFAFSNCKQLTDVTIPDSVTEIRNSAFSGCVGLQNVVLSANITEIAEKLFFGCNNLIKAEIPDSVTQIGAFAFLGTAITTATVPNGVTVIRHDTFASCSNLSKVTIPDSVTIIESEAFCNCTHLMNVTIPASVIEIEDGAFGSGDEFPDGFTIYGTAGTEAERYAKANRVAFISGEKEPAETTTENEYPGGIIIDDEPFIEINAVDNKGLTVEAVMAMIEDDYIAVVSKDDQPMPFDALVGTGCKIQMLNPEGIVLSVYTVIVPMDVNGDAKITAQDARVTLRAAAQLEVLNGAYKNAADANGDESLTASDARKILRKAAQLE